MKPIRKMHRLPTLKKPPKPLLQKEDVDKTKRFLLTLVLSTIFLCFITWIFEITNKKVDLTDKQIWFTAIFIGVLHAYLCVDIFGRKPTFYSKTKGRVPTMKNPPPPPPKKKSQITDKTILNANKVELIMQKLKSKL